MCYFQGEEKLFPRSSVAIWHGLRDALQVQSSHPSIVDVRHAASLLQGVAIKTPLQFCPRLSEKYSATIWLKREDLQKVRSYKLRGAYTHILKLQERAAAGVVCASAGNHAQGVAYSCSLLKIPGIVFVPRKTPRQKLFQIREHGGEFIQIHEKGDSYDETAILAAKFADSNGLPLVPPFDDADVIAGQGSVGLEIAEELGSFPDMVIAPIGGGGLAAGLALSLPSVALWVTEPAGAPSFAAACANGGPINLKEIDTFVDGASVGRVGALPFRILQGAVAGTIAVESGELCTSILELYQHEGIITEPAGALSVAALEKMETAGKTIVCIISGGNNDVSRYEEIIERSLLARGLRHYFLVEFAQRPGALRSFLDSVLGPNDDIVYFQYAKKNNREVGPAMVGIELASAADFTGLLSRMQKADLHVERIDTEKPLGRFLV